MKPGWHIANNGAAWDFTLQSGAFTLLHDQRSQVPALRAKYPDAVIVVRHYLPNWFTSSSVQVAKDIAAWYPEVKDYNVWVTIANEQNLASEGHPQGAPYNGSPYPPKQVYVDINNWNKTVIQSLRVLCPRIKIVYPALSQGHSDDQNDDGYVGFEICRESVELCDAIGVHTYWNGMANVLDPYYGLRFTKVLNLFPDIPIIIDEFNSDVAMQNDDPQSLVVWLNELQKYVYRVLGVTIFIWDSDSANQTWIVRTRKNTVNALRNYAPVAPPPTPTPPPMNVGWCPFASKLPIWKLDKDTNKYVGNFDFGNDKTVAVVEHIAAGNGSLFSQFSDLANKKSSHFWVSKLGTIEQYVSIKDTAWAQGLVRNSTWADYPGGNPNRYCISIENEGQPSDVWTPAMVKANKNLLDWIAQQTGLKYVQHHTLIGHSEINSVDRANDPGPNCPWNDLIGVTPTPTFIRPANDNGRGMHADIDMKTLDSYLPGMMKCHFKWIVLYPGDELQTKIAAKKVWDAGAMPIIRLKCKIDTNFVNWELAVKACLDQGIPAWVQIFNEPGDSREWNSGKYNRDIYVNKFRDAATRVENAGGYPGIQTLDPEDINAVCNGWTPPPHFWLASHAYSSNHPPNYPYDKGQTVFQDDTCALAWLEHGEWVKNAIGHYVPTIVTEGGWVVGQQEDMTYPRTTPEMHRDYHVALYTQFLTGVLNNGQPKPDWFYAYCPFLWENPDWSGFSWLDSAPLTVAAVQAMPAGGGVIPPTQTLEQTAQAQGKLQKEMPINDQTALYKFAQANNLGYPETDEWKFQYNGDTYIGQNYAKGYVYVKDGDWANCKWAKKI